MRQQCRGNSLRGVAANDRGFVTITRAGVINGANAVPDGSRNAAAPTMASPCPQRSGSSAVSCAPPLVRACAPLVMAIKPAATGRATHVDASASLIEHHLQADEEQRACDRRLCSRPCWPHVRAQVPQHPAPHEPVPAPCPKSSHRA